MVAAGFAAFWFFPLAVSAEDGFDPSCDVPENWRDDFDGQTLREKGWPTWFMACYPGAPAPFGDPAARSVASKARGQGNRLDGLDTSSPGSLWTQGINDPINTINSAWNNSASGPDTFRTADDFFLDPALLTAAGCQFEITALRHTVLDQGGGSVASDWELEIWNHNVDRPAGSAAAPDLAAGPFAGDSLTVVAPLGWLGFADVDEVAWSFNPPLVLSPGTYWVNAWTPNISGSVVPSYQVASGSFDARFCQNCVAWGDTTTNTTLDFDIDGSVVCPPPTPVPTAVPPALPVGGFAVSEVGTADLRAVTVPTQGDDSRLLWLGLLGLGAAVLVGAARKR